MNVRPLQIFILLLLVSGLSSAGRVRGATVLMRLNPGCAASVAQEQRLVQAFQQHEHSPANIPPQGLKRYYGMLVQKHGTTGTENQFLALIPYFSPFGHKTMYLSARKQRGYFETLWLGELLFANTATEADPVPRIRLMVANETSGQWCRWLDVQAGIALPPGDEGLALEEAVDIKGIRVRLSHANSVENLATYFDERHPQVISPVTRIEPFDKGRTDIHLDGDLNALVTILKQQVVAEGRPDRAINLNHDVRSPAGVVVSGITIMHAFRGVGKINAATAKPIFEMMRRANPLLSTYLRVLQNEYPDDQLLNDARKTLSELDRLEAVLQERDHNEEEQNELFHLKEVLEFVLHTADVHAVHFMDPISLP